MDRCLWIQEGEDDVRTGGEGKGFLRFFLNSGFFRPGHDSFFAGEMKIRQDMIFRQPAKKIMSCLPPGIVASVGAGHDLFFAQGEKKSCPGLRWPGLARPGPIP